MTIVPAKQELTKETPRHPKKTQAETSSAIFGSILEIHGNDTLVFWRFVDLLL